jgi:hypothetical protein
MTSTSTTNYYENCGAVDLGTRFCEACGTALRLSPVPRAGADPYASATALHLYLATYLASRIVGKFAHYSHYEGGNTAWIVLNTVSVIFALALAGSLLLAVFTSPVSIGRKVLGLTIVLIEPIFLLLALIVNSTGRYDLYPLLSFNTVVVGIVPILIVLAWLLVTGLPSKSYLALTIVIPTTFVTFFLARSMGLIALVGVALEAAGVVVSLITARNLARGPSDRRPTPIRGGSAPLLGPTPGTNTLAILALIFGVLGGTILPIIFGHIARSQIRRTGESGWGLALAGLILGYLSSAVVLILIIAAIAVAARSGTYL